MSSLPLTARESEQMFREAIARQRSPIVLPVVEPVEPYDPRWEWIDVSSLGQQPGTTIIRGACKHLERHLVTSIVTAEVLAQLCATCDAQLPPPPQEKS
jgi:hypothetical protein